MTWFRYVCHADVPAFEARGWVITADLGPTHGSYAVLMRYVGEGEPPC